MYQIYTKELYFPQKNVTLYKIIIFRQFWLPLFIDILLYVLNENIVSSSEFLGLNHIASFLQRYLYLSNPLNDHV